MSDRMKLGLGLTAVVIGTLVAMVAAAFVHAAEAEVLNEFGEEIYAWAPRGWVPVTIAQMVSVGGVLLGIGGLTFALLYDRPMTWSRAALGGTLFVALMFVIFAIVPNQYLTLTQATLEWTPQKIFVTLPSWLVLSNEVAISYAALKDILLQGYYVTMAIAVPGVMWWWQRRGERRDEPKPTPISAYGRPMKAGN